MKFLFASLILFSCSRLAAQDIDAIINPSAVEKIEKVLSSDAMRGRATFSPDIDRAADFIAGQFRAGGLQTWNNSGNYHQPFSMIKARLVSAAGTLDGVGLSATNIIVVSSSTHLSVNDNSGYEKVFIKA